MALQEARAFEVAQDRIQGTLLAAEHAFAAALERLGDLIAVHRARRRGEDREQRQRHRAGAQFALELAEGEVEGVAVGGVHTAGPLG